MKFSFYAKGHPNITSKHRSTFELTRDSEVGKTGDCIVGVCAEADLVTIPMELKDAIQTDGTLIKLRLETENNSDEIMGFGNPELTLNHPTDMVCRKSEYRCSRTLMIRADKAASDLKRDLIADLKAKNSLKVTIIV